MPGAKFVMMSTALPTIMVVTDGISLEHTRIFWPFLSDCLPSINYKNKQDDCCV